MLGSSRQIKLFIIKITIIYPTPSMCQVSYQEHTCYDC